MKLYFVAAGSLVFFLAGGMPHTGHAAIGNTPQPTEGASGNTYAIDEAVEVTGKTIGDVYAVGGTVVVSGEVEGDVLVLGARVRITGPVVGSVRVLGGEVELTSSVGRNVSVAAGKLTLAQGSYVFGHVAAAVGQLELRGTTEGKVDAAAGQVTIAGVSKGALDVRLDRTGNLRILETAVADGGVKYRAVHAAEVATGAKLALPLEHVVIPRDRSTHRQFDWWFGELVWLFGLAVLAMVLTYLMPRKLQEVGEEALAKPWQSLGWGVAWLVGVPVVATVLAVTLIGVPLAVVLVALYVVGFFVAQVAVGMAVGWYVRTLPLFQFMKNWKLLAVLLLGLVLYRLAAAVPFLGTIVVGLSVLWTWGALLRVQRRTVAAFA